MPSRSGPLQRRTRLVARTGLKRTPFKRTAMKPWRRQPAVPPATSRALRVRSGGVCEVGLPGCQARATDPSHRITTKTGGRHGAAKVEHDRLADVLHACRSCHDWIGNHPRQAQVLGLALRETDNPSTSPLLYRGRLALLDNQGGIDYHTGKAAA